MNFDFSPLFLLFVPQNNREFILMLNPHQNFKEWLSSIDNTNLLDIAFLQVGSPYFNELLEVDSELLEMASYSERMMEKFWEVIDNFSKPSRESAVFFVNFKALFDFTFENRANDDDWNEIENNLQEMLQNSASKPVMENLYLKLISDLPERKKAWKEIYEGWNELKNNALSNKNLRLWEQSSFGK